MADTWRPAASDPWWAPDYSKGPSADHFDPTPFGALPVLSPGRHELLVSLLGSYDVVELNPDGTRILDLLGRCVAEVDVRSGTTSVMVVATFVPDPSSFRAACSLDVTQS